jgi:hypothetical protein
MQASAAYEDRIAADGQPAEDGLSEAEDLQGFPIRIEFVLPGSHGPTIRYKNVVSAAH